MSESYPIFLYPRRFKRGFCFGKFKKLNFELLNCLFGSNGLNVLGLLNINPCCPFGISLVTFLTFSSTFLHLVSFYKMIYIIYFTSIF